MVLSVVNKCLNLDFYFFLYLFITFVEPRSKPRKNLTEWYETETDLEAEFFLAHSVDS